MAVKRDGRREGHGRVGMLIGLLVLLLPWLAAWSQGNARPAEDMPPPRLEQRLSVAVDQGRLSVDLWEVDVREVLAQIGQQAGIPIFFGASSGKQVSAHFVSIKLEQGLRRLLRLTSLSHAILYAQGPAGAVAVKEVRVFEAGREGAPLQPSDAERDIAEDGEEAGRRVMKGPLRAPVAAPLPAGREESEGARRFHEALADEAEPQSGAQGALSAFQ
jgi:hypothetical protein